MMKNWRITFLTTFVAISISIYFSCSKRDFNPFQNVVYLTSATTYTSTSLTVDNTGTELPITVTSSNLVNSPVSVSIAGDTSLVSKYNHENGKGYTPLPSGSYEFSGSDVTILPGTNISNAIKFRVLSTKDFKDGKSYMMPITIKNSNSLAILGSSKTLYVVVNKVIISAVASLARNFFKVDLSANNESIKSMTNVTYEARVKANEFQSRSPFISSIMGIEENLLLRFGDVTVQPNQLQWSGFMPTNVGMIFSTNTWYHIAATYNGSQVKIYVNGEVVASKDHNKTIDLTYGSFFFGKSTDQGRFLDGAISEARVWSKALSQAEILNGMCGIDPASPGLEGYWKFNEGRGDTAYDISGKGRHAIADRSVTWIPNVRCN